MMKISTLSWIFVVFLTLVSGFIITSSVISMSNANAVYDIWHEFELNRSEKTRALNALRSKIGYGGMIHSFKNYILRHDVNDRTQVLETIAGSEAAIDRYRSTYLSYSEESALLKLEETLGRYNKAVSRIDALIAKGDVAVSAIDKVARVNDTDALVGMAVLDNSIRKDHGDLIDHLIEKAILINEIKKTMGYGGLIHNFKNYILRGDDNYYKAVFVYAKTSEETIKTFRQHELTDLEKKSLNAIEFVVSQYKSRAKDIKKLISEGKTAEQIDLVVKVNDQPALDGLNSLVREVYSHNEKQAVLLSNKLNVVLSVGETMTVITIVIMTVLILLSVWVFRFKIIKPVNSLIKIMDGLSSGNYSLEVPGAGEENEIGEMARSVEVFKNNSIQRDELEEKILQVNRDLEMHVEERTHELSSKKEVLRSILETAADAIITISEDREIQSFNSAAEKMFGYKAKDVLDKNVNVLMPDPYKTQHDTYVNNYLNGGPAKVIGKGSEVVGLRKNGDIFPMELAVSEVQVDEVRLFTGIVRDLTEIKQVENQLRQSRDEAQQANRIKSDFLSSMSHELRTPLNSILGFTQILEIDRDALNDDQINTIKEIASSGHHLLSLINDVLDLSKIESGHTTIVMQNISLIETIKECVDALLSSSQKKDISINVTSESDVRVLADNVRLRQVLLNLISNAIKYNKKHGNIDISVENNNKGNTRVSISDNGAGLSQDDVDHLFTPFERLSASCSNIEGTGIGLVISKRLLELMNGIIGVESTVGKGSVFWFELESAAPLESDVIQDASDENRFPHDKTEELFKKNILYIEDNVKNLMLVKKWVKKATNYNLITTTHPLDGLSLAETYEPELILLDINLPEIDGYEVLKRLRQNEKLKHIPVVAVTARAMYEDIAEGMTAGFNGYVTKPIDLVNLADVISCHLNGD